MTNRRGDWIQLRSGIRFWPLDPRPDEIDPEDIAFALAYTNRFNGHVGAYSVAEHCVRVRNLLREQGWGKKSQLAGLLHDAAEIYVSDVPRPVKMCMRLAGESSYDEAERLVLAAVEKRFGLDEGACSMPEIKIADAILLATERRDLFANAEERDNLPEPMNGKILPMHPEEARRSFETALTWLVLKG